MTAGDKAKPIGARRFGVNAKLQFAFGAVAVLTVIAAAVAIVSCARARASRAMTNDGAVDDEVSQAPPAQDGAAPLKLEEFLPYRLNVVASLVSQALSRIYAERYGIGVPEWRVLVTLGQYGLMTGT